MNVLFIGLIIGVLISVAIKYFKDRANFNLKETIVRLILVVILGYPLCIIVAWLLSLLFVVVKVIITILLVLTTIAIIVYFTKKIIETYFR